MDSIIDVIIKFLDLFSTEKKQFKTMKNLLFLILISVITFKTINFFIGVHLDFNITRQELFESVFTKITLISIFTYVFFYGIFKGIIIYFLPNYFLNKKNKMSNESIKKIKTYTFTNSIIEKIKFTENPQKTSRYILEPYIYLIMLLLCFNISILTIVLMIVLIIMLFSAGNIISIYNNFFEKEIKKP